MGAIINACFLFTIMYAFIVTAQVTSELPTTDTSSPSSINSEQNLDTTLSTPNREERHFFIPGITTCNFVETPGRTCRSCTHTMTCLQSNIAFVKRCHFFYPYCNNGFCSFTPGSLCSATSSSTTSTSSTLATTTTVAS